ncbi:E3 ubiquitin-protein ligase hrd-1 [Phytophthora cinnamomi]|uniref:E3 ubiquitin-protein ligase hrd-1 n=1 Tax=Phytophthora cinnamomi TaxID=4785 RepID=UPI00355939A4|nr:E3 ubiquitin-protein ligase hrd-1 [Phytophthora cinnamomi]
MELQLNVTARYATQRSECVADVLRHFESPAWVRLVLRQVLPQLKQISPTDPKALTKMVRDAERIGPSAAQEIIACAICMAPADRSTVPMQLPCGHRFHCGCARSWLTRRSTCPLCRFQLPKAYAGTFAIAAVQSTLVLPPEHDGLTSAELPTRSIGCGLLRAAVKITMARVSPSARRRQPCQVRVDMIHANGSAADVHCNGKRRRGETTPDAPANVSGVVKRVRTTV